jgi:hypothetical protein
MRELGRCLLVLRDSRFHERRHSANIGRMPAVARWPALVGVSDVTSTEVTKCHDLKYSAEP